PVPEWPERVQGVTALELGDRTPSGADGIDEARELGACRGTDAHRARQHATRRIEHEELSRRSTVERTARDAHERVRSDPLDGDDATTLAPHASPATKAPTRRVPSRSRARRPARRRAS